MKVYVSMSSITCSSSSDKIKASADATANTVIIESVDKSISVPHASGKITFTCYPSDSNIEPCSCSVDVTLNGGSLILTTMCLDEMNINN